MELTEQDVLNAFIGFCVPSGAWPSPLASLGYVPVGVEAELPVRLNGSERTLTVDLICGTALHAHLIRIDAKSRSISPDQARKFDAVSGRRIANAGFSPIGMDKSNATAESTLVAGAVHESGLKTAVASVGTQLPIITCDGSKFRLVDGNLRSKELRQLFSIGIEIRTRDWPRNHVQIDRDSPDGEFAARATPAVVSFILKQQSFTVDEIAEQSIRHWKLCGRTEKQRFRSRITKVLDEAARTELSRFIQREGPQRAWRRQTDVRNDPRLAKRLSAEAERHIQRIREGRPYVKDQPHLL